MVERIADVETDEYCFRKRASSMEDATKQGPSKDTVENVRGLGKRNGATVEYILKDVSKSFSRNAGYYTREAKRMREAIKFHEAKAVLCKERSKVEP
jgi:hypothetical protein